LEAYRDIAPFLAQLGIPPDQLRIYDPYYCNGAVQRHLHSLGFPRVSNEKVDCYEQWNDKNNNLPQFDVLVTNPPYSDNHMERLVQFVTSSQYGTNRPWFLILPQWVHKKDFYVQCINSSGMRPFYLVPRKRYVYQPPKDFRAPKKSDVHQKSSPFCSMWYCWGGSAARNEQLIRLLRSATCDLARSKSALRDLRRKQPSR